MSQTNIIPFGKYKGQPIEVLQQDKQYLEWLQSQSWFKERYGNINTLIINNFTEPSETPEHNKIQAMFTDREFCKKFMLFIAGNDLEKKRSSTFLLYKRSIYANAWQKLNNPENLYLNLYKPLFEQNGIDVIFRFSFDPDDDNFIEEDHNIGVEIKPELSDDFPAVLRQMQSNKSSHLLIHSYTGIGATIEQVKDIFSSQSKKIILLSEIP